MRIRVDMESDALYVRFSEDPIEESEEVADGVILDYDAQGRIVGLEIVGLKKRLKVEELHTVQVELPTGVKAAR